MSSAQLLILLPVKVVKPTVKLLQSEMTLLAQRIMGLVVLIVG